MTYRIDNLKSAKSGVVSVKPTNTLSEAISKMSLNDYSQLAVMTTERSLVGFISWKTIGMKKEFGSKEEYVKDFMNKNVNVVKNSANFLDSVNIILENEFVFVKDDTHRITGIVTQFDIAQQFRILSEPFIELESIESSIRKLIETRLNISAIVDFLRKRTQSTAEKTRTLNGIGDLTFGEYLRVMENEELWAQLDVNLDRNVFVEKLNLVREIRNNLMHFRTTGISDEELKHLKDVSKFFRILESISKKDSSKIASDSDHD